ncbi:hypothetical protein MSG28_001209 [Choristoneura fumiferana]|uniref:Uncharacterized protein n=1 Tax=Choristoneura fumiferana TaxID=7141 RepID=A0ACC0K4J4_CHOFU|nr:hypothetical protein MSG28_001209 [Choristoneura fumiferana]
MDAQKTQKRDQRWESSPGPQHACYTPTPPLVRSLDINFSHGHFRKKRFTQNLACIQKVLGPCARSARIATTILLANPPVKQQCVCCVSAWRVRQPVKLLAQFTMLQYGILFGVIFMQPVLSMETEVVVLRAVRGQDARLPCGQGKVFLDGPDAYVLWLKNDREFLYRFPNEETERRSLTLDQVFGTTCVAGACHDDTSLLLKRVSDRDGGIYRCRVHYQASPSVDYVIEIRLVDSPGLPRIYNDAGELLKRGHIQHLSLGANLTLTCVVDDEQPDTLVFWRRNGAVAERAHAASGSLRATVRVRNATRAELDAHYECLAQNADVTEPLSASVLVTMYLPPLSVEIRLNNNVDFEAGQPRVVDCVVVGCVPPPSITWHLGDTLLRPSVHKELHDGNYTVSSLTLAPSLRDSGRELACRAHNSHLPASVFQDKVTLNVGYRPICLSPGEEVVGAVQREAETVSCVVEASPEPLQFSWTFADSRTLYTSVKVVGSCARSARIPTTILLTNPAVKQQCLHCCVSAWRKLPGHQHRYSSTLTWLPRAGDSGPLLCRATNAFGEQKRPCAYAVAAGGAPAAPDCVLLRSYPDALRVQCKKGNAQAAPDCVLLRSYPDALRVLQCKKGDLTSVVTRHLVSTYRNSPDALRVQCKKGWDGGRPQTIHLTLRDADGTVLRNVSDAAGHFHLQGVGERNLSALVYASSIRGRSREVTLHLQATKPLSAPVIELTPARSWTRWLEVAAGGVAVAAAVAATALCVRALRARRENVELNPDLVPRSDGEIKAHSSLQPPGTRPAPPRLERILMWICMAILIFTGPVMSRNGGVPPSSSRRLPGDPTLVLCIESGFTHLYSMSLAVLRHPPSNCASPPLWVHATDVSSPVPF